MRALVFAAAAFVSLAPVASAQTPAQLLVGEWHCSAPAGDLISAGAMIYKADGSSTFDQQVTGPIQGMDLIVRVVGTATWSIGADGKLTDNIMTANAVSGTIGDRLLSQDVLASFGDELKNNGLSVSDFTVDANKLHISDGKGGGSNCTRKAAS